MVDLALLGENKQDTLSNIANRQDVSINYLEQTFSMLKKAGLIYSIKGAQGGYKLSQKPSDITIKKVLKVLEGDLSIIEQNPDKEMTSLEKCIKHEVWDKIDEKVNILLSSITIKDLVNENIAKLTE
ncbi:MAG: transcriptional regulator, Rrf2 family [Clostridiales bacterium]|nr:transcriptional regulator, Rrf2 family [Clostridiales bacterium]